MSISPGDRFGHYEIAAMIGVGGMGEVYRARDATLDREVAIKVLPDSFAADGDRIVRFEREAKTLASLNHVNIAHIYGLDRADGVHALVMELVEGPTLAERIAEGPLPADEALKIAAQIADALEAAHEHGIVHRDLKPANVKLSPDGTVKLLDFGVAKALDGPLTTPQGSILTTPALTQAGVVLGTAPYMSPEQARGKPVDERADIWAFGCVLYEMLKGRSPFIGDDVTTTLARVLERDPDLGALPTTIAPAVRRTIALCLQKEPRKRIADIRDVKLAMAGDFDARPVGAAHAVARTRRARVLSYAAAAILGGAVVTLVAWTSRPAPAPRPLVSFATMIPDEYLPTFPQIAIARDGSRLGFATARGPVVRNVGDLTLQPVPAVPEPGAGAPCFSPDGTWIAYGAQRGTLLKKAPLAGGAALTLTSEIQAQGTPVSCDWGEDGHVYFTARTGLMRVAESGGPPELLAAVDGAADEIDFWFPQLLPDHRVLFAANTRDPLSRIRVYVLNLETREKTLVLKNAGPARYALTDARAARGHLVYGRDGTLFAVPIDLRRLEIGAPSAVLNGLARVFNFSFADVSSTGALAYFAGPADEPGAVLTWLDRAGEAVDLQNEPVNAASLALSPDGRRAAVAVFDIRSFLSDIWIYDLDSGRRTRLTFGGVNAAPVWTPDGARIIYSSRTSLRAAEGELRSVPADSSSPPITLAPTLGSATSISADSRSILVESAGDVQVLPVDEVPRAAAASTDFRSVLATTFNEHDAAFSPDGRFIAYASNESGSDEVYLVPYPGPGAKFRISIDGGRAPRWHPNGRELFYVSAGRLMAVSVETTPTFRAQTPRVLFTAPTLLQPTTTAEGLPYSVAPDGARFLTMKPVGATARADNAPRELRTIFNWFEELRRLAPVR